MEVVENDEQRPLFCCVVEERRGRVEEAEACAVGLGFTGLGHVWVEIAQLGQELAEVGDAGGDLQAQQAWIDAANMGVKGRSHGQ